MDVYQTSAFSLPPGDYRCRLVIRDLENGKSAIGSAAVNFAPTPSTGLSIRSPLLLVPGSNFLYLGSEASGADPSGWKAAYPYNRALYTPVLGEIPSRASKLYALVPCACPGLVAPEIALTAWLIDTATGAKIPLMGLVLDRTFSADGEIIFVELTLANVAPGRYRLYLHAADSISRSVGYTQTALVVK